LVRSRYRLAVAVPLLCLLGCTSGGAPSRSTPAPDPSPTATPGAAAAGDQKAPPSTEEEKEAARVREAQKAIDELVGKAAEDAEKTPQIVLDPKTGVRQLRIEKAPQYYVVRGRLYNAVVRGPGDEVLREDDKAYYVAAPDDRTKSPENAERENREENPDLAPIIDIPQDEEEVVTPARGATKVTFEELSEGLPTSGMWRETFALGDLDGDRRPDIVTPPPRLSGQEIRVFKLQGKRWISPPVKFEDPEQIGFEYGGTAVGDLDGDGRLDIVYGRHGGGPAIAFNKGGLRFKVESRGIPREMSTRAMEVGDLDGDAKLDIIAISDTPEYTEVRSAEAEGNALARQPKPSGYIPGYDVRAYLQRGDRFEEVHQGLEEACFGYAIALVATPADKGAPFFGTGCRYRGLSQVVYAFDRGARSFATVSTDIAERYAYHNGAAAGTYRGFPALYMSYIKTIPSGGSRQVSGNGVVVYYRENGAWKKKRIWKSIEAPILSSGLAAGDLNGDGLDDVVFADDSRHLLRIFFQKPDGSFEEPAQEHEPAYVNHATSLRMADVDGDGRRDLVLMYQFLTGDETRAGGLKFFRNVR
jgi:hypothetical protein